MDLDGDDMNYLGSGGSYSVPSDLAGAAAVQASSGRNTMVPLPPSGPYGQSDDPTGQLGVGADMDAIVAESVKEMRRRSSLANGFGLDYLSMGDDESYSAMVSPTGSYAPPLAPGPQTLVPTTLEEVMAMSNGPVMMGYAGPIPGPDLQQQMSMYPTTQAMTPRGSEQSPLMLTSPSMPTTPAGSMGPSQLLSRGTPVHAVHNFSSDVNISKGQGPGPPGSDASDVEHPMKVTGPAPPPSAVPQLSRFPENVYSSSGFNMFDILNRVATRPNPQIDIGAVDMSCAFVVTDARQFDNPIIYCSATFERLTGYSRHEILGKNCRFLQAPNGTIEAGERRKYVDESAVIYIKNQLDAKEEAQTSLINYRKGGQSFTNLLTMVPISFGNGPDDDVVYFVGFQVDLVDQPGAMMHKNRDGSYSVNYQYLQPPTYMPAVIMDQRPKLPMGRDDVSQVLSSFGTGDPELHSKRILDKVLLENTDDVVHVLSLKGLFLYCSPSIRKVLEYEPHELVGTSLSGVCHPSDIVPVTRELKDTPAGSSVSVVFRIRRKFSGYTWFESHGCLHTEQGKGRKCIILVGRARPVYMLRWSDVKLGGGIGESELWTKMSTSGMFLFVSSNSKLLLDREASELMGTSVQALMRPDSRNEIGKALQACRKGKRTHVRHEIQNKRGQFLQALTILFPGDWDDQRPTFFIAQTRLLKHTRASISAAASPAHKALAPSAQVTSQPTPATTTETSSHDSTPSGWSGSTPSTLPSSAADSQSKSREGRENSTSTESSTPDDNMFEELKTTRSTSWQFELRQMQKTNKRLTEELASLLASKKKRKRRKGADQLERDCANCHTRTTPEWRRGPSGKRDLCNSCGLRYAKLIGKSSSRTAPSTSDKGERSPLQQSPMTTQPLSMDFSPTKTACPLLSPTQPMPSTLATVSEASSTTAKPRSPLSPFQQSSDIHMGGTGPNLDSPISPTTATTGPRTMMPSVPPIRQQVRRGSMGAITKQPLIHARKGSLGQIPSGTAAALQAPQSEMVTNMQFSATPHTNGTTGINNTTNGNPSLMARFMGSGGVG